MSVSELAMEEGLRLARRFFASRGNKTEAHLSEAELAALMALAYHRGELKGYRSRT